jgi:hypothetical protein
MIQLGTMVAAILVMSAVGVTANAKMATHTQHGAQHRCRPNHAVGER